MRYRLWQLFALALVGAFYLTGCSPLLAGIVMLVRRNETGTITPGQSVSGTTTGAGDDYAPQCGAHRNGDDEEWVFVPAQTGRYDIRVNGQYDCVVAVFETGSGEQLACNDDHGSVSESLVSLVLQEGQSYTIVVDGYRGASGDYQLVVNDRGAVGDVDTGGTLSEGQTVSGSTEGGQDNYTPPCGSRPGSPDDVWAFTPNASGQYEVAVDGQYDCNVAVYPQGSDQPIGCNDDAGSVSRSRVTVHLDADQTYHVVVDGYGGSTGSYQLRVARGGSAAPGPAGPVQTGGTLTLGQQVTGSTAEGQDNYTPPCGSQPGSPDNVWSFTPPSGGEYVVAVNGQYDCNVAVYPDGGSQPIGCNDDAGAVSQSRVTVQLDAGQSYHVVVDGYRGASGTYTLVVQEAGQEYGPDPRPSNPTTTTTGDNVPALEQACAAAPILTEGQTQGQLAPGDSNAALSCGGGGRGSETVYRVVIDRPGTLTVAQESAFDAVLELRSGCSQGAQVVSCNDDTGDTRHSTVSASVEQGTYFLIVDSYMPGGASGPFTLNMTFAPQGADQPLEQADSPPPDSKGMPEKK